MGADAEQPTRLGSSILKIFYSIANFSLYYRHWGDPSVDKNALSKSDVRGRQQISGIEVSRGIAAILVILYHASRHVDAVYGAPLLRSAFQFGHAGVDLFFVISGFIILCVHYNDVGNPKRFGHYVQRRLTRVFPTYWVALALTIVMALFYHGAPAAEDLLWSAFLLPSDRPNLLGIAWTLRFEMLFYAMFCVAILNRRAGVVLLASWFTVSAFCAVSGVRIDVLPEQFQSVWSLEFLLGMAVAYMANEQFIRRPYVILSAGLLLFTCSGALENLDLLNGYADFARVAYGIPSALLVLGIAGISRGSGGSVPGIFRALGRASYSLYLFQFIFIGTVWQLLLRAGAATISTSLQQFAILSAGAIVGGVIISNVVEQPLIRLCRGWIVPAATKQLSVPGHAPPPSARSE